MVSNSLPTGLSRQQHHTDIYGVYSEKHHSKCHEWDAGNGAQKHTKDVAVEEAWRAKYNKEERKKRYVERGAADKRAAAKKPRTADD